MATATHFVLLLVALSSLLVPKPSLSAGVFLSVDCGTSNTYIENSIEWTGDDAYIQNGESLVVPFYNIVPSALNTLRVFSTRKKNCYSIKVDKGERLLVRASFFYGNYDAKDSPPVFDLQFDGNYWATVNTSSFNVVSYEVIYDVKGNATSICVAQTHPDQLPFISALELRSLGSNMYSHVGPDYALLLSTRTACSTSKTVRYPADAYDRIWERLLPGLFTIKVTNDAVAINVIAEDNPPPAVLQQAIASIGNPNTLFYTYIILPTDKLPAKPIPIYIALYFSEVNQLNSTQKRSFRVYKDNKPSSDTIIPPFGGVSEVHITNMTAASSTNFTLQPTPDSTLSPLINAMEIYTISDVLTDGTNSKDVEGLATLQRAFNILEGWSGDPCLPSPFTWDWVECSADATPRVTALKLSGYDMSGSLPDFSSMDALQTIDLHNNNLNGSIPDFLGSLTSLTLLDLADNRLSGALPTSLSKNNKLKLVLTDNCFNVTSCPTKNPSTTTGQTPFETPPSDQTPIETPPFAQTSGGSKKSNKLAMMLGAGATIQLLALSVLLRDF